MFYCNRIKNGLAFTPNGDYDVCCERDLSASSRISVSDMSPADFLKSDYYLKLNEDVKKGNWPKGCEECQWAELVGFKSLRQAENFSTEKRLHVVTSNVCDSDCIMCGPNQSSSIAARLKKFPDPNINYHNQGFAVSNIWKNKNSVNHLIEAMKHYDVVNFIGGEPFLDKNLWNFLKTNNRSDLILSFVTNNNTSLDQDQIEIFSKFKQVRIGISVDATDDLYEWIRDGLNWSKLLRNILALKQLSNVVFGATAVVQAHNILNLSKLDLTFSKFRIPIHYQFLTHPALLSPRNAPRWALEQAYSMNENNDNLKKIIEVCLKYGPMHDLETLKKHTDYLNSHRTLKFNTDIWAVER